MTTVLPYLNLLNNLISFLRLNGMLVQVVHSLDRT
jgi:hypothetical protein